MATFLDVIFDDVWRSGLTYKIYILDVPTKLTTHWLSDFLVGLVIQVNVNRFMPSQISLKAGVPQGSALRLLLFLIYASDLLKPNYKQN